MAYRTTEISDTSKQSFVSETFKYRIIVSPVTTGTEKQVDYAGKLKLQAMKAVDQFATSFIASKVPDNKKAAFEAWRDALLSAIDADTDARQVLDKLASIRMDTESIMTVYNILPQQYA